MYKTSVQGFTEESSQYNITVEDFTLNDAELYVDVTGMHTSVYGNTYLTLGTSMHQSLSNTSIVWDGGLVSEFSNDDVAFRTTVMHTYKMFYAKATTSSVDGETFEIGFNLQF